MTQDKTKEVVEAIAQVKSHGECCDCSVCQIANQTIAQNPDTTSILVKVLK